MTQSFINMHKKLSTKRKIIVNSIILLILFVAISGNALYSLTHIGSELRVITKQVLPLSKNINRSKRYFQEMSLHVERAINFVSLRHFSGTDDS